MFKSIHPAVQAALIFAVLCLLMVVKPCEAQTTWITCKYIPTGAIQSFPDYCPADWVRI
jgi:hypothetical protein